MTTPGAKNKDILDLDALAPEPKHVILGGKEYEVLPPRFRQLIMIQRVLVEMGDPKNDSEAQSKLMDKAEEVVCTLIPEMKKDKTIDLTFQQLMVLLSFVMTMADEGDAKESDTKKK